MSELGEGQKPGTYTGADGREYRINAIDVDAITDVNATQYVSPGHPDWSAAKAALDALVEQEGGEWVEIDQYNRISRDGQTMQYLAVGGKWVDYPDTVQLAPLAYRRGREVAQQESVDLRDAARELVNLAEEVYREWRCSVKGCLDCEPLDLMQAAAKALEEKL